MKKAIVCILIPIILLLLSGCSGAYSEPPGVKKMESTFSEHKEDFQSVADYLTDTYPASRGLESVYINESTITVFRKLSDSTQLDKTETSITDTPIAESYKRLKHAGCQSVSMDPKIDGKGNQNVICFRMWSRDIGQADAGIAYAVNGSSAPQVQFQTELKPLSEDGWYYYLADYENWRITKPTYISTYD